MISVAAILATLSLGTQTGILVTLNPAPGPLDNPLKGWCAYVENWAQQYQPYSMGFIYANWRELEPTEGNYNFGLLDTKMNSFGAVGKHVVLRVQMDYPSQPTGVPQWLIDKGITMNPYTEYGGGLSPDYDDPRTKLGIQRLIQALGARYSNNSRVATIQLGILGFWGEWHTYPRNELFASLTTQRMVIDELHQAFPKTHLMARTATNYQASLDWIGFHDDTIPQDTLGPEEWMFLPRINAAMRHNNWKAAPIGGEMVPGGAAQYMGTDYAVLRQAVQQAHISWIGPYSPVLDQSVSQSQRARCEEIVRMMGYEYRLTSAKVGPTSIEGNKRMLTVTGVNQGVAPFYYPWKVVVTSLDSGNRPGEWRDVPVDIRKWLPGAFKFSVNVTGLKFGSTHRLVMGIIDPLSGQPRIRFANAEANLDGWQTLISNTGG